MESIRQTEGRQDACDTPHRRHSGGLVRVPARAAILLVKLYQKLLSPWLGQHCRFHPSCSNYCIDALHQHGMVHGLWLGLKRICKCHPFHPGGFDPVPKNKKARSSCGFPPQRTPGETEDYPPLTSVNSSEASGE
jgi:putative membrane protein insertion efficiency factor